MRQWEQYHLVGVDWTAGSQPRVSGIREMGTHMDGGTKQIVDKACREHSPSMSIDLLMRLARAT